MYQYGDVKREVSEYITQEAMFVDKYLADGWELYGSPVVNPGTGHVIQALVKYREV